MQVKELTQKIEHTLLKPDAGPDDFETLCKEALEHKFYAVCVPLSWVEFVKIKLSEIHSQEYQNDPRSIPKVVTVIGFPLGNESTPAKVEETRLAIDAGADEIDMVIQIGRLKAREYKDVEDDVQAVVSMARKTAAHKGREAKVKLILEAAVLTLVDLRKSCQIAKAVGVDFVKTSTGFHSAGGAQVDDVKFLAHCLRGHNKIQIKAAGGIDTWKMASDLINAGATRLGSSKSVKILEECKSKLIIDPQKSSESETELRKRQFQYAWDWFHYHAQQRTSMFHFFLVSFGALAGVCGWLWAQNTTAATLVAVIAGLSAIAFFFIDFRNGALVKRAERVLQKLEYDDLFQKEREDDSFKGLLLKEGNIQDNWVQRQPWSSHSKLIPAIQALAAIAFFMLAGFASCQENGPSVKISLKPLKETVNGVQKNFLHVIAKNNSNEMINHYQVDLEIPTELLDRAALLGQFLVINKGPIRLLRTKESEPIPSKDKMIVMEIPITHALARQSGVQATIYGYMEKDSEMKPFSYQTKNDSP